MNIKLELLKGHLRDIINSQLTDFEINADEIADTTATRVLAEIQEVLFHEDYSDFEIVENIVRIFIKYDLDFGGQHDF